MDRKHFFRPAALGLAALMAAQLILLTGCGGGRPMPGDRAADNTRGIIGASPKTEGSGGYTGSTGTAAATVPKRVIGLEVWGEEEDQKLLREQCDEFCRNYGNADVSVTIRAVDEDSAVDAAFRDMGSTADVYVIKNSQLAGLVGLGAVSENTLYRKDVASRLSDDMMSAAAIGGRLYGYPMSYDACVLYYDKSKLGSKDIISLEGISESVRKKRESGGPKTEVCPLAADFSDAMFSSSLFLTAGIKDDAGRKRGAGGIDLTSDESVGAARYIAALGDLGVQDMDEKTAAARFKAGTLASYVSGMDCAGEMSDALGENYAVAELPSIKLGGEDRHLECFADGRMYVVKSNTAHPAEASALANWLTSDRCQLDRLHARNLMPSSSNLSRHADIADSREASAVRGQLSHTVAAPVASAMESVWEPVAALGRELFGGKVADKDIKGRLGGISGKKSA